MAGAGMHIDGAAAALERFTALATGLDHAQPMWAQIGAYGVTSTQRRFERGVGPDGNPWPPSLRVKRRGGKTLILSTRLVGSQTFNESDGGVEWGTNVVYAAIHQLGGDIEIPERKAQVHFKRHKRTGARLRGFRKASKANETLDVTIPAHTVHMPPRAFLGIDEDDAREITAIAEQYVAALADGGGA